MQKYNAIIILDYAEKEVLCKSFFRTKEYTGCPATRSAAFLTVIKEPLQCSCQF